MATIGDRLKVLVAQFPDKSITQLGVDAELGQGTVNRWMEKPVSFHNAQVEKFIRFYNINENWWKTGEGPIFNEGSNAIQLYERLIKAAEESRDHAQGESIKWQQQSEKWEQEAAKLHGLLEMALRSKLTST
jgi:hypothetical protein